MHKIIPMLQTADISSYLGYSINDPSEGAVLKTVELKIKLGSGS